MKFLIQQKVFSIGDNFKIKDEFENDRYIVKGKVLSLGGKLRIYDMAENELVYIEQKLLKLMPEYNVYMGGQHVAKVKKEFTLLKNKFDIQSSMGEYAIDGDFFGWDFKINKNGIPVAEVSKKFFAFADTYGVEVAQGENEAFMLALVIVIDQVLHKNN
jgi:uncharacterized protein YxjI